MAAHSLIDGTDPAQAQVAPRMELARALIQSGADTSPAYPMQAIARAIQPLAGHVIQRDATSELARLYAQQAGGLADVLEKASPGHPLIAAARSDNPLVQAMAVHQAGPALAEIPRMQLEKQRFDRPYQEMTAHDTAQIAEMKRQHDVTAAQANRPYAEMTAQQAAALAEQKRQHDIAEGKPVSVPAGASLVDPRTGTVTFKGSDGLSEAANEVTARQIISGDLSGLQNIGRGAQGDAKLTSIKNKAAELLTTEYGLSPKDAAAHLSGKLQEFKAAGVGATTEARTTANREANLNLILKATDAAIPAALEASQKVARTGWVPINRIIQGGQVMASSPELKEFGMANLQLAEHWARAMNPTGVMRESDRDKALGFLSTADSPETYQRAVMQLKTQITRERDAIKAPATTAPAANPAAETGGGAPAAPSRGIPQGWGVEAH